MASRRLRIKPVANVPIRRGKNESENVKSGRASENGEKEDPIKQKQEDAADTRSVGGNSQDINYSPLESSEQDNVPHSVADLCSQNANPSSKDAAEALAAGPYDAEETIKSQVSISGVEAEAVGSESATTKMSPLFLVYHQYQIRRFHRDLRGSV